MTDRINSFLVVLDHDIRDDDIEPILNALRMVRHVLSVEPHVASFEDHVAESRARHELGMKALNAVRDAIYGTRQEDGT